MQVQEGLEALAKAQEAAIQTMAEAEEAEEAAAKVGPCLPSFFSF